MAAGLLSTEEILKAKYPAKAHARKVAALVKSLGGDGTGLLYLESQKTRMIEDNDEPMPFRQRRYFYYLTGCELPDAYATYDMASDKLTLFIPPIDPDEVIWSGLPTTVEDAMQKYDIDACIPSNEVNPHLASENVSKTTVHAIANQVSDEITFLPFSSTSFDYLKKAIEQARVVKDEYEIALIRHANAVSTAAHKAVMKAVRTASNERELEALFLSTCIAAGCRDQAYHSIVASGTSCATLHYNANDAPLAGKLNLLLDAGCQHHTYASDITRTFPINGTFTPESRSIYEIVLRMQAECTNLIKAGYSWDAIHEHGHRVAIDGLLSLGILRGASAETLLASRTSVAFFPHGLGHYLGMDTHDCGGNPNYADKDPMFRYLRVRGTLPAGSVVTVEPGIYFCRFIIEPYLKDPKHAQYIDTAVLDRYWDVGGVRIEDNILVTETGHENLTTTPKSLADMESLVKGA